MPNLIVGFPVIFKGGGGNGQNIQYTTRFKLLKQKPLSDGRFVYNCEMSAT